MIHCKAMTLEHIAESQALQNAQTRDDSPGADSYTANRLVSQTLCRRSVNVLLTPRQRHASPQHLHITARRCFIGPIPEGWLKSHRKVWYKSYLSRSNYSSRSPTFSASNNVSQQRRITGLDGPSAVATYRSSFPQPTDLDESDDNGNEEDGESVGGSNAVPSEEFQPFSTATEPPFFTDGGGPGISTIAEDSDTPPSHSSKPRRQSSIDRIRAKLKIGRSRTNDRTSSTTDRPSSFVTARETPPQDNLETNPEGKFQPSKDENKGTITLESPKPTYSPVALDSNSPSTLAHVDSANGDRLGVGPAAESTSSLLPHRSLGDAKDAEAEQLPAKSTELRAEAPEQYNGPVIPVKHDRRHTNPLTTGLVKFDIPGEIENQEEHVKAKYAQFKRHTSFRRPRSKPGEILKMEKMLVRVDYTMQQLPPDYDENDSQKTDSRAVEKWREFVVVCRGGTDNQSEFLIQMYQSRVIPAIAQNQKQNKCAHEIPLIRKTTKVNLYSSLDKTVVVSAPWKKGTRIYILRPRSSANSVEWYTFLHTALGWKHSRKLQVNVPDLSVTLQLSNPFGSLEDSVDAVRAAEGDEAAINRTMAAEKAVARGIIERCMKMLEDSPEWANVLEAWLKHEKMGLAWKRFDRLEWVHGANEQKMYGTLAMQKSHDLELRPKQHYPTTVRRVGKGSIQEPTPVEGFLIRLTSQRGQVQRLGKMFFKRLYFFTHNQYLCFCRPAKATPPAPPNLPDERPSKPLSLHDIVEKIPLIYGVNPYPVEEGHLSWLQEKDIKKRRNRDHRAYEEIQRKVKSLVDADGYMNLCKVTRVRNMLRGSTPVDDDVDQGSDVDFHEVFDDDTAQDDGTTTEVDDDRTFEVVLENGLVVRLQAYNVATKKEWMGRLRQLVKYWKLRTADDVNTYKVVRQTNMERLNIDEENESFLGQSANKWEVARSVASPQLFNMCGISCCRAITVCTEPQRIVELLANV